MKFFLTLVVLLFAGSMGLKAQNVLFFDSRKGLSNSCIKNIYEDSRHNLWITTLNVLNCYDGAKMKTYRHEVGNPTSLLQDECTCVLECDSNTMLVGTGLGMQTFDALTERFTYLPYLDENGDLHISGRKKQIIIRNGNNLSIVEIENRLLKVAGVKSACVVTLPSQEVGEVPGAMISTLEGEDISEIQDRIEAELPKLLLPEKILFTSTLPLLPSGKYDRVQIKKALMEE